MKNFLSEWTIFGWLAWKMIYLWELSVFIINILCICCMFSALALNIYSNCLLIDWHLAGGISSGCLENAGAAGTLYDAVPKSLTVNNHNLSTDTETLLLEFPFQPLWTNVYIRNRARASVPLLWSRVQVWEYCLYFCNEMPKKCYLLFKLFLLIFSLVSELLPFSVTSLCIACFMIRLVKIQ